VRGDDYGLSSEGDILRFSTERYRTERGSILHGGIYNPDLSSLIGGAAVALLGFMLTGGYARIAVAVMLFATGFVFFRLVIFKKRGLVLVANRAGGTMTLSFPFKRKITLRIDGLLDVASTRATLSPENPEGVRLVEKIALHHYTVLPDFEKPLQLYPVELRMKDGRAFTIYAGEDEAASISITKNIKEFLKVAKAD
jgi:hypothetical protein